MEEVALALETSVNGWIGQCKPIVSSVEGKFQNVKSELQRKVTLIDQVKEAIRTGRKDAVDSLQETHRIAKVLQQSQARNEELEVELNKAEQEHQT